MEEECKYIVNKGSCYIEALLQWLEKNHEEVLKGKGIKISVALIKNLISLASDFVYGMLKPKDARRKIVDIGDNQINQIRSESAGLASIGEKLRFIEKIAKDITMLGFR